MRTPRVERSVSLSRSRIATLLRRPAIARLALGAGIVDRSGILYPYMDPPRLIPIQQHGPESCLFVFESTRLLTLSPRSGPRSMKHPQQEHRGPKRAAHQTRRAELQRGEQVSMHVRLGTVCLAVQQSATPGSIRRTVALLSPTCIVHVSCAMPSNARTSLEPAGAPTRCHPPTFLQDSRPPDPPCACFRVLGAHDPTLEPPPLRESISSVPHMPPILRPTIAYAVERRLAISSNAA